LGIFQDIVSRCSKSIRPVKKFSFSKNIPLLRWSIVVVCLILFFFGFSVVLRFLDPFSVYGRIAVHVFSPVYMFVNNVLASFFTSFDNYTFYKVNISVLCVFSFSVALFSFFIICIFAWFKGRLYCNTFCPVGTVLGFLNKFSLFKVRINNAACSSCGICAANCKASCIDVVAKSIDYTQCVNCFNCLNSCNVNGLSFALCNSKPVNPSVVDNGKRKFLLLGLGVAAAPKVLALDHSVSNIYPQRSIAISPPGSVSVERLLSRCSSCHLCISKCPSKVLKPAFLEYGFAGIMLPTMSFDRGFCNYNCTTCSSVCPSLALLPLSMEQKHRLQVGKVIFIPEICVVHTDLTSCGACSEHCPTQAVKMIPYKNGLTIPFIDVDICVGCGGCEYICPVRPFRAIFVEGNSIHQEAKAFYVEPGDDRVITEFGF
jgi:ferredoxin